jgi:membrane protein DedA with SNARE-associated domain
VGWWVGRHFAQTLREQPVRLLHLTPARVARAEAWFARWGAAGVFVGRVVPLVRSFVSVPAGALGMRALPYALLTLPGAAVWSFALAAAGWAAGAGYHRVDHAWRYVEAAVAASLALVVVRAWPGWRGRRTR